MQVEIVSVRELEAEDRVRRRITGHGAWGGVYAAIY